jgi:hypothetical protein
MMTDTVRLAKDGDVECGCVLSADEKYRYVLWRIWDDTKPKWMFALLNPSTATEAETDPTITRQIERAKRGGAGGIIVVNTAAIRETDSDKACRDAEPIGPHNHFWVKNMLPQCETVVAGWGPKAARYNGGEKLMQLFDEEGVAVYALKINKDGSPGHPLYIGYDAPLIPYEAP